MTTSPARALYMASRLSSMGGAIGRLMSRTQLDEGTLHQHKVVNMCWNNLKGYTPAGDRSVLSSTQFATVELGQLRNLIAANSAICWFTTQ